MKRNPAYRHLNDDELILKYIETNDIRYRNELVISFQRLVSSISNDFIGLGAEFKELVQVGNIGLINGIGKFDPQWNTRLITYVTHFIRGEILHYLRNNRHEPLRIPAGIQSSIVKFLKTKEKIMIESGRIPNDEELMSICNFEGKIADKINACLSLRRLRFSLDDPFQNCNKQDERWAAEIGFPSPDLIGFIEFGHLKTCIGNLPKSQKYVIWRHFIEGYSLTDIAKKCNLSINYISQLKTSGLERLRRMMQESDVRDSIFVQ